MKLGQWTLLYMRILVILGAAATTPLQSAIAEAVVYDFSKPEASSASRDTSANDASLTQVESKFLGNYAETLLSQTKPGQLNVIWRGRIISENVELETQSSSTAGLDLRFESRYNLHPRVEANVYLRGKFESGHSQSFFGDIEPSSAVFIRNAAVDLKPMEEARLRLGVIDQNWMRMPLLTYNRAFPGIQGILKKQWTSSFSTRWLSQLAIPTSSTLSTRTVDQEKTPNLVMHTLNAEFNQERKYTLGATGGLYEFKNLPSFIAHESQQYGNDSSFFNGLLNSRFTYPFKGWYGQAYGKLRLDSSFEPYGSYSVIKNNEAPETFNDGHDIRLGMNYYTTNYVFNLEYAQFFAESDVVPAYYNSWAVGHTNKEGAGLHMFVEFKKYNFRVRSYYYKANLINAGVNSNGIQQNQDLFFIGLETAYDTI